MLDNLLKGISIPSPLSRERCQHCKKDFAVVECRQCNKYYCKKCEIKVHTLKENPHKNDSAYKLSSKNALWHKNARISCNLCHTCHDAVSTFYCKQCTSHQCKECCTTNHNNPEMSKHSFFCVEGTNGILLKTAVWSPDFIDMAKAKRRERLISLVVVPKSELHALSTSEPDRESEVEFPSEKKVDADTDASHSAPERFDIKAEQQAIAMVISTSERQPIQKPPAATIASDPLIKSEPFASSLRLSKSRDIKPSFVDLTLDDSDSEIQTQSPATGSMNNHSLMGNTRTDTDQKLIWTMFEFSIQDPIMSSFIEEYNRLNSSIETSRGKILQVSTVIKDFIAQGQVTQALEYGTTIEQIKKEMTEKETQRDAILGHLILYTCHKAGQQQAMASQLNSWSGLDLQYVQEASHRKCFQLEKEIQLKQQQINKKRQQMEEAIVMKPSTSFQEVTRLNQMVQEEEKQMVQMEQQRTKEILRLFEFSHKIRTLVQKQLNSSLSL